MKRWRAASLLALLSALPILFAWDRSPSLLEDSDTRGILGAIRAAHDPLKWFRGDWPIANHFYRPVSSLVFEADNALYGGSAAGYGLTNALLCFACVLLLFWLLREVTDRPWASAAGAGVFALWHVNLWGPLSAAATLAAWATLAAGVVRHRGAWRAYVPAFLTLFALAWEVVPLRPLQSRMIDWIPGRTASTMAVFALLAMASYARFERLRRPPAEVPITPETPPATRNTEEASTPGKAWPWAVVALVATALALGSYEQAVMLPPVLLIVAGALRIADRGSRIAGGDRAIRDPRSAISAPSALHAAFWLLLLGYLVLRWALLPHDPSGYQRQQYSSTRTALWGVAEYLFAPLAVLVGVPEVVRTGWVMLLTAQPYVPILRAAVAATGYWQARRERALFLLGWLGSAVAFAPMAWFKIFEHYHYWPMALRAGLVVALGSAGGRLAATAWSPPARPAPPRPRPAPGSLPRP